MSSVSIDSADFVRQTVGKVSDPELQRPLSELGMITRVEVTKGIAEIGISLTISACPMALRIERDVRTAAKSVSGILEVQVSVSVVTNEERAALRAKLRGGRNRANPFTSESLIRFIAVSMGKGGVCKSTVTTNLAAAMAAQGLKVGIVDARRAWLFDSGASGPSRSRRTCRQADLDRRFSSSAPSPTTSRQFPLACSCRKVPRIQRCRGEGLCFIGPSNNS